MSIMSDRWIRDAARNRAMIEPFEDGQRREGMISYGLSSYGYDARVADEFKIFTNVDSAVVDTKDFAANSFVDRKTDEIGRGSSRERVGQNVEISGVEVSFITHTNNIKTKQTIALKQYH